MSENYYPKVLFIANNPFSLTSNNGKTYTSLFGGWDKENISQIYFHNEWPDMKTCSNFYRITEEQILFDRKENVGEIITKKEKAEQKKNIRNIVANKASPMMQFLRNVIWHFDRWDNEKLFSWLEEFSPEIIFFVGGSSEFTYYITNIISERLNLPVCIYYTDDYFYQLSKLSIISKINRWLLERQFKKLHNRIKKMFVIGEKMKKEYTKKFNVECIPVMNSVDLSKFTEDYKILSPNKIELAYFGGLHLKRIEQLIKLSKIIEKYNQSSIQKFYLSIYTGSEINPNYKDLISKSKYSALAGFVDSNNIIKEMSKFDVLIHIESFDPEIANQTRLSVSTKIPEYLAMRKPIFAIGPPNIASIEYLCSIGNNYICESTELLDITAILDTMSEEKNNFSLIGQHNYLIAKQNHTIQKNRKIIYKSMVSAIENDENI